MRKHNINNQSNPFYFLLLSISGICLFFNVQFAFALSWQDLWTTPDQQARNLMQKGQYAKAQEKFTRPDWHAAAAYRAGNYEQAAKLYQSFNTAEGYYNQGNALAHMGDYEAAINAYDKALSIKPNFEDALYNRKLLQDLRKKEQQDKEQQDKEQQDKEQQDKEQQDKEQRDKEQRDKEQRDKEQRDKEQQDKEQQDKEQRVKEQRDKEQRDKEQRDQKKNNHGQPSAKQSSREREKQQAREQWLRLIPDDPGGLLREKFLRDHLRRQHGW
ncbi:TPR repeat containing protein [Legionella londiniensis]|uniref:TPR repeat containing protein n=1 Tax=Legionella londiniensis TaxID=45068 RepID=A0A0W0VI54_9GAMM|nr:tetratricopeptide repeat protein [Legionella londiniensis]KTD19800.1 TPR repeat containing protein [Legionella londiniensis]